MKYQVSCIGVRGWTFGWLDLPVGPGHASSPDWLGAKAYANYTNLPVRELDDRGIETRAYYPALFDEAV